MILILVKEKKTFFLICILSEYLTFLFTSFRKTNVSEQWITIWVNLCLYMRGESTCLCYRRTQTQTVETAALLLNDSFQDVPLSCSPAAFISPVTAARFKTWLWNSSVTFVSPKNSDTNNEPSRKGCHDLGNAGFGPVVGKHDYHTFKAAQTFLRSQISQSIISQ